MYKGHIAPKAVKKRFHQIMLVVVESRGVQIYTVALRARFDAGVRAGHAGKRESCRH